jgi:hypothetical protein
MTRVALRLAFVLTGLLFAAAPAIEAQITPIGVQYSVTATAVPGLTGTSTSIGTVEFTSTKPVSWADVSYYNHSTHEHHSETHFLPDAGVNSGTLTQRLENTDTGDKLRVEMTFYFTDGTSYSTEQDIVVQ